MQRRLTLLAILLWLKPTRLSLVNLAAAIDAVGKAQKKFYNWEARSSHKAELRLGSDESISPIMLPFILRKKANKITKE